MTKINALRYLSNVQMSVRAAMVICNYNPWPGDLPEDGRVRINTVGDLRKAILSGVVHRKVLRRCGQKTWLELLKIAGLPGGHGSYAAICPKCGEKFRVAGRIVRIKSA